MSCLFELLFLVTVHADAVEIITTLLLRVDLMSFKFAFTCCNFVSRRRYIGHERIRTWRFDTHCSYY